MKAICLVFKHRCLYSVVIQQITMIEKINVITKLFERRKQVLEISFREKNQCCEIIIIARNGSLNYRRSTYINHCMLE